MMCQSLLAIRRPFAQFLILSASLVFATGTAADDLGINLSFDDLVEREDGSTGLAGWTLRVNGIEVRVDNEVMHGGVQSLRFRYQDDGRSGLATQTLPVDEVRGRTLILGGYLRGDTVAGRYSGPFVRVDGEDGILVQIRADRLEPRGSFPWTRFELRVPVDRAATAVYFGMDARGEGTLWVDDLYLQLESQPRARISDEVEAYLDSVWEIFRSASILRDEVDWDELREDTERQLRGARFSDEAWPAIRGALNRIGDGHSSFMTPAEAARWADRRPSPREAEESTPTAKLLGGRIGYIVVPKLISAEEQTQINYANILQTLIARAEERDPCGYIVDLRGNSGGNMWPMLLGLGPLVGDGEVGAFVDADGDGLSWAYRAGAVFNGDTQLMSLSAPLATLDPLPPVAVLIDAGTASSAEALTAVFRGRAGSLSFGQDTAGISTGNRGFILADGSRIFLTATAVADRTGTTYGKRISVEVPVDASTEEVALDDDPVVLAARDWLAEDYACTASP
jgi:carboxyl-terminal processing protease